MRAPVLPWIKLIGLLLLLICLSTMALYGIVRTGQPHIMVYEYPTAPQSSDPEWSSTELLPDCPETRWNRGTSRLEKMSTLYNAFRYGKAVHHRILQWKLWPGEQGTLENCCTLHFSAAVDVSNRFAVRHRKDARACSVFRQSQSQPAG